MKLSCLPVSFFDEILGGRMSVGQWAAMGAAVGLDAVDMSILFVPDRSPQALVSLRREIEDAGMRLTMLTSYPDFTHPDPDQRRRELELERGVVDAAAALGARYVRVTAGQAHPGVGLAEGTAWAIEGLTRLVERTSGSGITLVYENHAKPGAWIHTDFSQPPELFLAIVEGTRPVGLRVNFDFGNAAAFAVDPVRLMDQVIDRIETVHAADTRSRGRLEHVALGTGVTPYPQLLGRLKRFGWDGWICMEEASHQGRDGVAAAVAFIRSAWDAA
jgi:sugar phosphate isomerase/epimerase